MAENSKIEWCDHTFNPWEGCTKVGPGCDHCYAEARNIRFTKDSSVGKNWGSGAPRRRTSAVNWNNPIKWNKRAEREGVRYRVFCASLSDVFDNEVNPAWRADLFELIRKTPHLDWLLLTKRIGNVLDMVPESWTEAFPRNVWIGATMVNQDELDRDIVKLLAIPSHIHFISMEPLLGSMDLSSAFYKFGHIGFVDQIIVGGESGSGARPMYPDYVRSLRDQCRKFGIKFFFKQWGEWSPGHQAPWLTDEYLSTRPVLLLDYAGCRVATFKVGKKKAGRKLDGNTYSEFPRSFV